MLTGFVTFGVGKLINFMAVNLYIIIDNRKQHLI